MSESTTQPADEFDLAYAAEQIRRSRHPIRQIIKGFYLRNMLEELEGPTIDIGCGAGQLLDLLPEGSEGLELNPHLVKGLCARGLRIRQARGDMEDFDLAGFAPGRFQSLVMSHVLEHLPDPAAALTRLFGSCVQLGIRRVLIVVPGAKGFAVDPTHKTFVDPAFMDQHFARPVSGFQRSLTRFFPFPWESAGRHLTINEMMVRFDRSPSR